jgi:predicted kinase
MRKRSRRGPNDSEYTGKIGQELPPNQLPPLRPSYPEPIAAAKSEARAVPESESPAPPPEAVPAEPLGSFEPELEFGAPGHASNDTATDDDSAVQAEPSGSLVHETQPESPSVPPPEPVPAGGPKQPRGFVVLTIGLPGSGKTTWFKRRSVTPLSSDMLRNILFDDITEQRYQGLVFSTLRSLLRARLIAKMPWNYVDATNLSPHERRQWIKMAKSFGYEVQAVFFDVPFEICKERNSKRERVVSDEVMEKMNERLRPPSFKEGFSKITVVRVKGAPPSEPRPEIEEDGPEPVEG